MEAKDLFYAGAGALMLFKDKAEEELQKMMDKGKVSKDEVREFMEKAKEKGSEEEDRFKEEMKKLFKEMADDLGLATKEDIEEIKRLINKTPE